MMPWKTPQPCPCQQSILSHLLTLWACLGGVGLALPFFPGSLTCLPPQCHGRRQGDLGGRGEGWRGASSVGACWISVGTGSLLGTRPPNPHKACPGHCAWLAMAWTSGELRGGRGGMRELKDLAGYQDEGVGIGSLPLWPVTRCVSGLPLLRLPTETTLAVLGKPKQRTTKHSACTLGQIANGWKI